MKGTPILLPINDQQGIHIGSSLIWRESISSVFYNHHTGEMVVNVKQFSLNIGSRLLISEESTVDVTKPKDPRGNPATRTTGKYRNDIYTQGTGGNEQIILTEVADIRNFWKWISEDDANVLGSLESLFADRDAVIQKTEEMKAQAKAAHEAKLKEAEQAVQEKINPNLLSVAKSDEELKEEAITSEIAVMDTSQCVTYIPEIDAPEEESATVSEQETEVNSELSENAADKVGESPDQIPQTIE